jgi:hypothetical protein
MARYKIITLVDITKSNSSRSETDSIKKGQQANFNTLIQTIGIRSNLAWQKDPIKKEGTLPDPFNGKSTYWEWEFDCENIDVFLKENNPVGLLKDDLHGVPIIDDLENTVQFKRSIFDVKTDQFNIFVEII